MNKPQRSVDVVSHTFRVFKAARPMIWTACVPVCLLGMTNSNQRATEQYGNADY
jgi:hypothetical protein